jgi:cis-3-alkyl-4-acyloxetan-2-one decarboxylase
VVAATAVLTARNEYTMVEPSDPRFVDVEPTLRPVGPKLSVDIARSAFAAEYPFSSHWFNTGTPSEPVWMHYVDEGPRDAPVIVFVHGNPTWSFYWRKLIIGLRDKFRCIAVDHIGMGLSDRPQSPRYLLNDHLTRLRGLVDALQVKRAHWVGHDWGGCMVAGMAVRRPDEVQSITWMNTAAFISPDIPFSIAMCRWPVFGPLSVLYGNAFAGVAAWRAPQRPLSAPVKKGYLAPYQNAHDRIATLRFVEDIPLHPSHPSHATLATIEAGLPTLKGKPITLFWGDADFCFTPTFRKRFEKEFPAAEVHAWPECGHYVLEDAGDRILPLLRTKLLAQEKL